jgi:hypothetical protein
VSAPSRLPLTCAAVVIVACSGGGSPGSLPPVSCVTAPDGTSCGTADVCSEGACVAATTTRTVSGQFRTVYQADIGATPVDAPPQRGALAALQVSSGSGSTWTRVAATADAAGSFSVTGLPVGQTYIELDTMSWFKRPDLLQQYVAVFWVLLYPLAPGADLADVVAARPDLARVSLSTPLTTTVTNLAPWTDVSSVFLASAQVDLFLRVKTPQLALGATSYSQQSDWSGFSGYNGNGLPDAAKGDVVFWY